MPKKKMPKSTSPTSVTLNRPLRIICTLGVTEWMEYFLSKRTPNASTMLRIVYPMALLNQRGKIEMKLCDDFDIVGPFDKNTEWADVFMFPRIVNVDLENHKKFVKRLKDAGKMIIFEHDDWYWQLGPSNYRKGDILKESLDATLFTAEQADLITSPNPYLNEQTVALSGAHPIMTKAIPNGIFVGEWNQLRDEYRTKSAQVRILLTGATNHYCLTGDTLVVTDSGKVPISELVGTTGLVLAPGGYKSYENVHITKKMADIVKLSFEGGESVRCTPDHLFLTSEGWVQAIDLTPNHMIRLVYDPNNHYQRAEADVSGENVLPLTEGVLLQEGRLLNGKGKNSLPSPENMGTPQWANSPRNGRPSQGWEQGKQLLGEPGHHVTGSTPEHAHEKSQAITSGQRTDVQARTSKGPRMAQDKPQSKGAARQVMEIWTSILTKEAAGKEDVYDLTVPDGHAFCVESGIVVHNSDWLNVMPVIKKVVAKFGPRVKISVFGINPDERTYKFNNGKSGQKEMKAHYRSLMSNFRSLGIDTHGFLDFSKYAQKMCELSPDIGIISTTDAIYDKCKSTLKFADYTAAGAAVLCPRLLPYTELPDDAVSFYDNQDELFSKLCALITDTALRKQQYAQAATLLEERYDIGETVVQWESAFLDAYRLFQSKQKGTP